MNRGKICISVCAETADELFRGIDEARGLADVVEVRFDCHSPAGRRDLLERIISLEPGVRSKILATLRPPEQGGMRAASIEERLEFWNSGIGRQIWGADLEEDIIGRVSERPVNTVA